MSYSKDPNALLDYRVDWGNWLSTDTIVSATVFIDPSTSAGVSSLVVATYNVSSNSKSVIAWLSAGVLNAEYTITYRVHTTQGRRNDQSINVIIEEQ